MKLSGIFPPLTTPFTAGGEIDLAALKFNLARYNKTRLIGYVLNGSTSESVLLTWDEVERLWATAKEFAAVGKILIAGTGAESTPETIRHTKRAAELGFHAALVRTPSYYKPFMTFEAQTTHFLRVADASPIPVLIYSVPVFTGYTAEAPLVARLASHANIVGIKDSSGNVQRIADIVHTTHVNFNTLTGSALTLEDSLAAGACGAILAVSCIFPEGCVEFYEAARAGDKDRLQNLKRQFISPAATIVSKFGIPGIKCALDRLGYKGGAPRGPLMPVSESAKQEIESLVSTSATPAAAD